MKGEAAGESSPSSTPKKDRAGRNLPAAIGIGVLLVIVVISTLIWWNWGFVIFIAMALGVGVWEFDRALRRLGFKPAFWPLIVATPATILLSYWAGTYQEGLGHAAVVVLFGLIIATISSLIWRMRYGVTGYVKDAAASLLIIGYLLLLGSTFILMIADVQGSQRVAVYLLCVVASDTGAYAFGVFFGKHKMAPAISPAKSWEGFAGGCATATIVGAILAYVVLETAWWFGALLGLAMSFSASVGDLIESAIKRDVGVKDMSGILPGHGGAMDRLDSLVIAGPVAWVLMYFMVPR